MARQPPPAVDVTAYLYLVAGAFRVVRPQVPAWLVDSDDLFQEGVVGLMVAASRYNPGHGSAFASFAYLRVRGAMLDHARTSWRVLLHATPYPLQERRNHAAPELPLVEAITVRLRMDRLTPRQQHLITDWIEGRPDAARARDEGRHRSTIMRERHAAFAILTAEPLQGAP